MVATLEVGCHHSRFLLKNISCFFPYTNEQDGKPGAPEFNAQAAFLVRRRQDPRRFPDVSRTIVKLLGGRRECRLAPRARVSGTLRIGSAAIQPLHRTELPISRHDYTKAAEPTSDVRFLSGKISHFLEIAKFSRYRKHSEIERVPQNRQNSPIERQPNFGPSGWKP
jgi:hypothetical protein